MKNGLNLRGLSTEQINSKKEELINAIFNSPSWHNRIKGLITHVSIKRILDIHTYIADLNDYSFDIFIDYFDHTFGLIRTTTVAYLLTAFKDKTDYEKEANRIAKAFYESDGYTKLTSYHREDNDYSIIYNCPTFAARYLFSYRNFIFSREKLLFLAKCLYNKQEKYYINNKELPENLCREEIDIIYNLVLRKAKSKSEISLFRALAEDFKQEADYHVVLTEKLNQGRALLTQELAAISDLKTSEELSLKLTKKIEPSKAKNNN